MSRQMAVLDRSRLAGLIAEEKARFVAEHPRSKAVLAEPALTNMGIVLPDPGYHSVMREPRYSRKAWRAY